MGKYAKLLQTPPVEETLPVVETPATPPPAPVVAAPATRSAPAPRIAKRRSAPRREPEPPADPVGEESDRPVMSTSEDWVTTTVYLERRHHRMLGVLARLQGRKMSEVVNELVAGWIDRHKQQLLG
jgi:hypothetical protein